MYRTTLHHTAPRWCINSIQSLTADRPLATHKLRGSQDTVSLLCNTHCNTHCNTRSANTETHDATHTASHTATHTATRTTPHTATHTERMNSEVRRTQTIWRSPSLFYAPTISWLAVRHPLLFSLSLVLSLAHTHTISLCLSLPFSLSRMYTRTHTQNTHTHTHIHTRAHVSTHTHTHVHTHIHPHSHTFSRTHAHATGDSSSSAWRQIRGVHSRRVPLLQKQRRQTHYCNSVYCLQGKPRKKKNGESRNARIEPLRLTSDCDLIMYMCTED